MKERNLNPLSAHIPRQFRNGTWSCCARTHSRPEDASPRLQAVYENLYPHVTEWTNDLPDGTLEILFGIGTVKTATPVSGRLPDIEIDLDDEDDEDDDFIESETGDEPVDAPAETAGELVAA